MIDRFQDIARALVAVLLLGMAGAAAQTAQSQTSPNSGAASQAGSVPTAQAPAQPAGPAGPQINIAEITARANRDVGVNIETTINGWQHELDRQESALQKPRLRYSELNDLRDELQRVRAGIEDFWKLLEPRLAAAKDQVLC
jgi:potassium-dependent mechanosensitive channel